MNFLEKKIGKYAIQRLPLILIMCYGVGYIINAINPSFLNYLTLNPYALVHGQVWRIFSWIIVPPQESNIFFVLITLFFYYSIGTSLERTWGTFKFNVYILSGILFTVLGALALMGFCYFFYFDAVNGGFRCIIDNIEVLITPGDYFTQLAACFSTYYINMSIFLAYAATFPDAMVLLLFIIPVKVKWLGVIYGVWTLINVIQYPIYYKFAIVASLLNFLVFWLFTLRNKHKKTVRFKTQKEFKRDLSRSNKIVTRHKCAICGRTEQDSPDMQFRFCSKCEGNYEYCELHLYTHTHVHLS